MAKALVDAIAGLDSADFSQRFARYRAARTAFIATVDAKSQRYFSFQCWQEGVARYTELAVARLAANAHAADRAFLNDAQAAALANDAEGTLARILKRLRTISLKEGQRSNFYAVGAGEALLLDRASPGWHDRYLQSAMDLSAHFPN